MTTREAFQEDSDATFDFDSVAAEPAPVGGGAAGSGPRSGPVLEGMSPTASPLRRAVMTILAVVAGLGLAWLLLPLVTWPPAVPPPATPLAPAAERSAEPPPPRLPVPTSLPIVDPAADQDRAPSGVDGGVATGGQAATSEQTAPHSPVDPVSPPPAVRVEPAPAPEQVDLSSAERPASPRIPITFIPTSASLSATIGDEPVAFRRGMLFPPGALRVVLRDGSTQRTCTIWVGAQAASWLLDAKNGCEPAP